MWDGDAFAGNQIGVDESVDKRKRLWQRLQGISSLIFYDAIQSRPWGEH
jgi:hypothetical protein